MLVEYEKIATFDQYLALERQLKLVCDLSNVAIFQRPWMTCIPYFKCVTFVNPQGPDGPVTRVGKYRDIIQKMKISNKLYNNGCNTLMQYLMTISYQSFVPYVKT